MKRTLRRIIASMLTLAIALTGISFENPVTANAYTMTYEEYMRDSININDYLDTPFTMEIGNEKYFRLISVHPSYWMDYTRYYDWSVSDESIVTMEITRMSAEDQRIASFELIPLKAGTVTVTGIKTDGSENTVSMTIIVKGKTAKQKSCKHSWKTTTKATCLYAGTKTCKKCKLKKIIKKKDHQWKTYKTEKAKTREYIVIVCHYDVGTEDDPEFCLMEFSEKDYGSFDAAYEAYCEHQSKCKHVTPTWQFLTVPEVIGSYTATVTRCKKCNQTKESVKKYE